MQTDRQTDEWSNLEYVRDCTVSDRLGGLPEVRPVAAVKEKDHQRDHAGLLSRISMPGYADCDSVMANLSVRLSVCLFVCHTVVLYLNENTYRQTLTTLWWEVLEALRNALYEFKTYLLTYLLWLGPVFSSVTRFSLGGELNKRGCENL